MRHFELIPITKALSKAPFDCGNSYLNDFLKLYALKNDKLSIGKTFIGLVDEEYVGGYLTVSTAQISTESLPADILKKVTPLSCSSFQGRKIGH
ncbi:MAG: hypothetical protein PF447_04605 [Spirochaetaceae bacterium]|nr:hypothetical protein [Spirochaetaceae bacterium]